MDKVKPNFALLLTTNVQTPRWENQPRWTGRAELVTIADDGTPRNIGRGSNYDGTLGYEGWRCEASLMADWAAKGERAYCGIGVEPVIHLELDAVVASGKIAARVQRAMDKMDAEFGRPRTWGDVLPRFAKALGVSQFVVGKSGSDGMYTSGNWTFFSPDSAIAWAEREELEFTSQHRALVTA